MQLASVLGELGRGAVTYAPGQPVTWRDSYEIQPAIGRPLMWTPMLTHLPGSRPPRRDEGARRGPGGRSRRAPAGDVPAPQGPVADGQPLLLPHRSDLPRAARPGPLGVPGLLRRPGLAGRGDAAGARRQATGRVGQVLRGRDGDPPRTVGAGRGVDRPASGVAPRSTCCATSPSTITSGPASW